MEDIVRRITVIAFLPFVVLTLIVCKPRKVLYTDEYSIFRGLPPETLDVSDWEKNEDYIYANGPITLYYPWQGERRLVFGFRPVEMLPEPLFLTLKGKVVGLYRSDQATLSQVPNPKHVLTASSDIKDIDNLELLPNLTALIIDNFDADEACLLSELETLTNLRLLDLSRNQLDDSGLFYIRNLDQLHVLILSWTAISDSGLVFLEGLDNIEELNLQGTNISGHGLTSLNDLQNLIKLDMSFTNITDDDIMYLLVLTNLDWLDVSETQISSKGLIQLRKGLKECEVVAHYLPNY
jgi:hypothetical protein